MCGICGIINFNKCSVEKSKINLMMQKMKHRGPDDEGIFIEESIGLGFVRLSIIDLSPIGNQPMFSIDGRYVIVYNGEVYNYVELREELKSKGHKFRSKTDSEVVLNSFIEWGESCLHKFNGMWAFAIYDRKLKYLFISRDRYGIKPFYYFYDKEKFIFASEIPPILGLLDNKPSPDYKSIFDFLVFNRTDQTENTFFKYIKKLQHGHMIRVHPRESHSKNIEVIKWYYLRERINESKPFFSPVEYRDTLSSAIGIRLRSDVPIGVCLSGGLDSSSIVSILLKDYKIEDLKSFSAIYGQNERGDESKYIKEYKFLLNNMFYVYPTGDTLLYDLDNFINAHCEPLTSTSSYAQFKIMELAKGNVVVTLDGQGADEQLAGYHYFFGFYFKELLKRLKLKLLLHESLKYLQNHNSIYGLKTFAYFLLPSNLKTIISVKGRQYLSKEFVNNYSEKNVIASKLYSSVSLIDSLINHFEFKLEHLLKSEDRNSMWFSLESRVPFLDYRLVERTLALDPEFIIKNGTTKYLLRQALKDTLPENIRTRQDKIGFETPQSKWFKQDAFKKLTGEIIYSDSFTKRDFIDKKMVDKLYKRFISGEIDIPNEIWKWIHLELWFEKYID